MKCTQFIGVILIWVSKFLWFTESATCNIRIEDPQWSSMWYLKHNWRNGYDMNVLPAWESCFNGTGVTVGVVDKGVQDHIDLNINRNLDAGKRDSDKYWEAERRLDEQRSRYNTWNRQHQQSRRPGYNPRYRQPQQRWTPRYSIQHRQKESLKHGTRVAGIVAAKKNGRGIVGIAFGAEIADITIASSAVFESFNAYLLIHRSADIDIYSCSFANFHTGTKTYPLLPIQKNALEYGTTYGRGRLGSVYVFATGNSGGEENDVFRDSCSYDRLVTNRFVISVAGIQHNLRKLPNGEACSAMMVAAFTSKAGDGSYKVVTTDIGDNTTQDFNQNSAAAPMVSGAVALALSANAALTYRDIMHLLVQTSESHLRDETYQSKFLTNAANIRVSSYFGFGLLDIGKLVERSKTWNNVPRKENCRSTTTYNKRLNSGTIVIQVPQCQVNYIEHVEISLKVNHRHAGQIQWVLVSPYGTKSTILPGRGLDPTTEMDITVLTVQLWGENPIGYWTLEPTAVFNKSLDRGTVESVELLIHGYRCSRAEDCLQAAEQDPVPQASRVMQEPDQRTRNIVPTLLTERSNECPSRLQRRCVEQCSNDRDCYGQICCYNGCGHTCERSRRDQRRGNVVSPVRTDPVQQKRRPLPDPERSNECPSRLQRRCVEQCSNDRDCYGQICCYNGCGHTCERSRRDQRRGNVVSPVRTDQRRGNVVSPDRTDQSQQTVRTQPEQVIGKWGEWSSCSSTCGYGTRVRERECSGTCNSNRLDSKTCFTRCPNHICADSFASCSNTICSTHTYKYNHIFCRKTCRIC
ncbi:neuroendocrine convertase 2-like [Mytilus edulis]|uniref:neuroendocrine convertase 2-like n=1 Tax=Mytilus edulis TaxID=6550 RepID=UPI0039EE18A0